MATEMQIQGLRQAAEMSGDVLCVIVCDLALGRMSLGDLDDRYAAMGEQARHDLDQLDLDHADGGIRCGALALATQWVNDAAEVQS
jgi:hypothetical protein